MDWFQGHPGKLGARAGGGNLRTRRESARDGRGRFSFD
jgi:hypothetical protein